MIANLRIPLLVYLLFCWTLTSLDASSAGLVLASLPFLGLGAVLPVRSAVFALIPVFCLLYTMLGIADWSLYRGPLDASVVRAEIALTFVVCGVGTVLTPVHTRRQAISQSRVRNVPLAGIYLLLIPGLAGAAIQVASGGFDLGQVSRFTNNPVLQLSIETLFLPLMLVGARRAIGQKAHGAALATISAFILLIFFLTGYRNFVVGGLIVLGCELNADRRLLRAAPYGLAAIVFFSLVGYVRQLFAPNLLPLDTLRKVFAVQTELPDWLVQLHLTARETIGITNTIVSRDLKLGSAIFFGDLATMLPGKQVSGGGAVAAIVGAAQSGGLTVGLIGAAIIEYGSAGYLFVASVTAAFYLFMRAPWTNDPLKSVLFAGYGAYQFVLTFHTGVLRPGVVVTDMAAMILFYFMLRGAAGARRSVRATG